MLRRQQAEALIGARRKLVEGAVSMVEMALTLLADKHVVEMNEPQKAAPPWCRTSWWCCAASATPSLL